MQAMLGAIEVSASAQDLRRQRELELAELHQEEDEELYVNLGPQAATKGRARK